MRSYAMLTCLVSLLVGCSSSSGDDDTDVDAGNPAQARWSVLVFMNGDNDLEEMVFEDLNDLEQAGSGDGVHVVVQADRAEGYDTRDGDWKGCRRYYITADTDTNHVSSQVLEEMGECDMGDPDVLSDFLMWAHAEYPAERMALFFWDHGDGWAVRGEPDGPVSGFISMDEASGNDLSIAEGEVRDALEAIVAARGPLDLVGFDACLMGSWEVAHSLRDQALTMCGSEALVGMEGYVYAPAINLLRSGETTAAELATKLASDFVNVAGEWTHSAVDLSQMDALATAVDGLAGEVMDNLALLPTLLQARTDARPTDDEWPNWYIDLYDLGRVLVDGGDAALGPHGQAVMDAMDDALIGNWGSGQYAWAGGLTIYFDPYEGYLDWYCYGEGATWAVATRWDEVLLEIGPR